MNKNRSLLGGNFVPDIFRRHFKCWLTCSNPVDQCKYRGQARYGFVGGFEPPSRRLQLQCSSFHFDFPNILDPTSDFFQSENTSRDLKDVILPRTYGGKGSREGGEGRRKKKKRGIPSLGIPDSRDWDSFSERVRAAARQREVKLSVLGETKPYTI
jgi:hypothetical protein